MEEDTIQQKLHELQNYALEIGSTRAQIMEAADLVVNERARARCFIPTCKFYGSSIHCPPHNPLTPEVTRRIVSEYRYGLLFQLETDVDNFVGEEWVKRHLPTELRHKEMVSQISSRAFHMGFPMAMGFAAGECSLCLPARTCAVLEGKPCVHPLRAHPAMEACGFDVFAIAQKAGWRLVPIGQASRVTDVPCASLIGLVLVG